MNLEQLAQDIDAKSAELAKLIHKRDETIRAELAKGKGPTELARIFGLTRGRIHQIRDNRR
jgi:hypothetical protein